MKRIAFLLLSIVMMTIMTSCSSDYRTAIPSGSKALLSVNPSALSGNGIKSEAITNLLGIESAEESGIDFTQKIYLFESADGNLGLCAKVEDESALAETLGQMEAKGKAKRISQRQDCTFYTFSDAWMIAFDAHSMLLMGPVVASGYAQMIQQMATYLHQDSEGSMLGSKMLSKLEEHSGAVAMVAQVEALPEQVSAIFSLGAPKDADASQIIIDADITPADSMLIIDGTLTSFNPQIASNIDENLKVLRPIAGVYTESLSAENLVSILMNADGKQLLPLMQQDKGLLTLLAGINQAIDLNAIIASIDGDLAISVPSYSNDQLSISMAAKLGNKLWLSDVDYWKQSVPQGGKITDWQQDGYRYTDGSMAFYFGVSADNQFMSGSSAEQAIASISKSRTPLPGSITAAVTGKRMAMVLSPQRLLSQSADSKFNIPLLGSIGNIVYIMK